MQRIGFHSSKLSITSCGRTTATRLRSLSNFAVVAVMSVSGMLGCSSESEQPAVAQNAAPDAQAAAPGMPGMAPGMQPAGMPGAMPGGGMQPGAMAGSMPMPNGGAQMNPQQMAQMQGAGTAATPMPIGANSGAGAGMTPEQMAQMQRGGAGVAPGLNPMPGGGGSSPPSFAGAAPMPGVGLTPMPGGGSSSPPSFAGATPMPGVGLSPMPGVGGSSPAAIAGAGATPRPGAGGIPMAQPGALPMPGVVGQQPMPGGAGFPGGAAGSGLAGAQGGGGVPQNPSAPVGTAEYSAQKVVLQLIGGELSGLEEFISPKCKGMLGDVRDGKATDQQKEELKKLFSGLQATGKPRVENGAKVITVRNADGATITFKVKKEGEGQKVTEMTVKQSTNKKR